MAKFSVGEVVTLISGGAKMTVVNVDETGDVNINIVTTAWMNNNNDLQSNKFLDTALVKVNNNNVGVDYSNK